MSRSNITSASGEIMATGRVSLVPNFKPPTPSSFRNMSHFDRLGCLLSLQDNIQKDHVDLDVSAIRRIVHNVAPNKSIAAFTASQSEPVSSGISLFGGAMVHPTPHREESRRRSLPQADEAPLRKRNRQDNPSSSEYAAPKHTFFTGPPINSKDIAASHIVNANDRIHVDESLTKLKSSAGRQGRPLASDKAVKPATISSRKSLECKMKNNMISERDFMGMATICHIAGGREHGLKTLVEKCLQDVTLSLTMICADEHLSSNLDNTIVKFCTPSMKCMGCSWACDRGPRVRKAASNILGAVILVRSAAEQVEEECYFLPLMRCRDVNESAIETSDDVLPLRCETTIDDRWTALKKIIEGPALKIVYNFLIFMLPLLHHTAVLQMQTPFSLIQPNNVIDPRVAKFMCGNDASIADIELQAILHSGDKFVEVPNRFEVDDSIMHGMGKISRKIHVQVTLLNKLIAAQELLRENLMKTESWNVFKDLEMPLVSLLAQMEFGGVQLSIGRLDRSAESLKVFIKYTEERIISAVGPSYVRINLQSPDQISRLLYDDLQLPRPAATLKSRHSSTSEKELIKLSNLHPVINLILAHRSAAKIMGTYIDGIRPFIMNESGENQYSIHACFNQTIASTGRLSCSRPNLQSIPKDGLDIAMESCLSSDEQVQSNICPREFFTSRPGCCLISIDYSQIEMRIMAHISGDSSLCQLFQSSRDVYVMLASKIFSKDYSAVSPQERNQAKVICLGVIYGMGAKMAAERLGIEISKVYSITTAFFTKFNGLREWMICVKREAAKQGFVATIFGRRRYLPEINSSNTQERAKGERQAVNTVIQGSASDLLKHVMLRIECLLNNRYSSSKNFSLRPRVLMQVHDELIYELPICNSIGGPLNCNPVVINFASSLVNYMTMTVVKELSFNVPLEVNVTVGFDWGHMQKLEINGRHVESDFKGVVDGNTSLVTDLSSSVRTVVEPDYSEDIDVAITEHIIVPPPLQMSLLNTNSTVGRRSVD